MVGTIQIRNPRIIEQVLAEMRHGAGRNPTEAAENLISQGSEQRRLERDRSKRVGASAKPQRQSA